MSGWCIPDRFKEEEKERDEACVYCGIQMVEQMAATGPSKVAATWEHIINDANIVIRENIARFRVAYN